MIPSLITHFMPLISFDTPWKNQKTSGLLMFSDGIKRDQGHEMGQRVFYPCMSYTVFYEYFQIFMSLASYLLTSRSLLIKSVHVFPSRPLARLPPNLNFRHFIDQEVFSILLRRPNHSNLLLCKYSFSAVYSLTLQ